MPSFGSIDQTESRPKIGPLALDYRPDDIEITTSSAPVASIRPLRLASSSERHSVVVPKPDPADALLSDRTSGADGCIGTGKIGDGMEIVDNAGCFY